MIFLIELPCLLCQKLIDRVYVGAIVASVPLIMYLFFHKYHTILITLVL